VELLRVVVADLDNVVHREGEEVGDRVIRDLDSDSAIS
jgi:hypothetical protein